jgi:hypothetical protein
MRADLPGLPGVLVVELQHRKLQRVHADQVLVDPLTLERSVVQLVDDDRKALSRIGELHRRWSKDADYEDAYDGLDEASDLARALIEAQTAAGLSPSQLALG